MPRYLRLALIAFIGFYLFHSPHGAAHLIHRAMAGLSHAGDSMTTLVNSI